MISSLDELLARVGAGQGQALYLVAGDLVLAEPAGARLAGAVAERAGCAVTTTRRPPRLAPLLEDLRTYSLFEPAKVVLAVDTVALADRAAAADLIDEVEEALPLGGGELGAGERQAASRFFQVLRLFDLDPHAGDPAAVVGELPAWSLQGGAARRRGRKARAKAEVAELRDRLAVLLAAARRAAIQGWSESELSELGAVAQAGLPAGHCLVLVERAVSGEHPLVGTLRARGAVLEVGRVAAERGGWQGLDLLAEELERQTGVAIARDALEELARRTLRQGDEGRRGGASESGAGADSTQRFAGEYRKLADLAGGRGGAAITRSLVEETVVDRGQEDVWQLLDAVAAGRAGEALDRLARLLAAAEDPAAARLTLFALLAAFSRQLTAVSGLLRLGGTAASEANYTRFRDRVAPVLQRELGDGRRNPVAGLHPFRLHRVYLAASRLPPADAALLPWRVFETETLLKGESGDPDAALAALVAALATSGARPPAARAARAAR
jgi:hypothetical protein